MFQTISFVGTVAAGSEKVLVSRILGFPFTVRKIIGNFPLNQNRLVKISFFHSPDFDTPATGKPSGANLLQYASNQPYIVGDDDKKELRLDHYASSWPTWLKVHAENLDGFEHDIDCQIEIEIKTKKEA